MTITAESWTPTDAAVSLPPTEVHLWRISLDRHRQHLAPFAGALVEEERLRAERFRFDRDRDLYVLSRGALRLLLSGYAGTRAQDLDIRYGSQGKPSILTDGGIEFNLSHSGGLCVIAVARGLRVGVDIEEKSRDAEFVELAERFFAPPEREALAALPQDEVRDAFYAIWTRKEAYIKALGEGVTHGLDNFSVDIRPEEPYPTVSSDRDPGATESWSLQTFVPRDGFAGALAVEGRDHRVVGLDYVRSDG